MPPRRRARSARSRPRSPCSWDRGDGLGAARFGDDLHRELPGVVQPGAAPHHLGHVDPALLEQPGCGVVEAVTLTLDLRGLGLEVDDTQLALLETASLLYRLEELLVVEMSVAEVPAVHHPGYQLAVPGLVVVDVTGRSVRQGQPGAPLTVQSPERQRLHHQVVGGLPFVHRGELLDDDRCNGADLAVELV